MTFGLMGQSSPATASEELNKITSDYLLSKAQQAQVRQLIKKRDLDLRSLSSDPLLDEPQRAIKRSSISKGFEGSIELLLNKDQRTIAYTKTIKNRKERIAAIEELKKKGYTESEILKKLDNK